MKAPSGNTGLKVRPDWLTFTAPGSEEVLPFVLTGLSFALGSEVASIPRTQEKEGRTVPLGWRGFDSSFDLVNAEGEIVGRYGSGGRGVRGRVCVDLPGTACEQVVEWVEVVRLLENIDARITRCDLCADFLGGEVSIDKALAAFRAGAFAINGQPPSGRLIDDLGSNKGRTLYVGSSESSKMARIYEKGKQLDKPESPWVRVEVQYRNRLFVLPFSMLLACEEYLAGSYPVFAEWLDSATAVIKAIRQKATCIVEKAIRVAHQQVSPTVAFLAHRMGWGSARIVRHLIGRKPSKRIEVSKACERFIEPHQEFAALLAEVHGDRLCAV